MERDLGYRRFRRYVSISKRKRIIKDEGNYWYYKFEGSLSKGKIHCSCPMCSIKSNKEALISDKRKFVCDIDELEDYNVGSPKDISKIKNSVRMKSSFQLWRGPQYNM